MLRAPARWWWIASALVHASLVGVVSIAPAPRAMAVQLARTPAARTELDIEPLASASPLALDGPVDRARDADGGAPVDPRRPRPLGGARNAQNIDSIERGERGDGRSIERGRLLATRAERVQLGVELRNAQDVEQVQRIRTGRTRESWQNDRRTPNPGEQAYLSLSAGELWFRAPRGPQSAPSRGESVSAGAASREGAAPRELRPSGDTERPTIALQTGAAIARTRAGMRETDGARAAATGLSASAQANIERGHASTTAERLAPRPSDDEDAAALAGSLARDALNATVHGGPQQGVGVGGVGGGGRAGVGGGVGEGGRASAHGEGDGALSLSSADPRYQRYFLALRRTLARLTEGSFPEEDALALREGRVMLELRVERSGALHVLRITRRSGIAQFDANVRRAIDGARGPAIPAEVSSTDLRVVYDHAVHNPMVR